WDFKRGCVIIKNKESKELNSFVESAKLRIRNIKAELLERGKSCTPEIIKNKFFGIEENQKGVIEFFNEHNERCTRLMNIDFAPLTIERYQTCCKHLQNFIRGKYKKEDIKLTEVNQQFIQDLECYLKTERKCNHNSAIKYLKNFKKIMRLAIAQDLITVDPFRNLKYRFEEVDMAYLNEDELNTIKNKKFMLERINVVRDVYIFCCYTGLAFSDVMSLCPDDLKSDDEGSMWIKKKRKKTKSWCHIPLLPAAYEILKKYHNHPYCNEKKVCLPVISNQKMNSYLKEIADVCGIKKDLSTHTARHTFATTVTLKNKVSIEVVSKMLGHSSINMTKKYARVVDELIKNDMAKLMLKFKESPMMAN
ncbi:MAG: site-specific integrase, partial [Bacteroidales bacterium]|nr:site-specific integrase [Bacteroidales bacterium]